jgi:ABC-type sugar transport system ATPase subunit
MVTTEERIKAPPPDGGFAIDARGVEKVYGPTVALAGASLRTRAGEIHALLGENGAGKSTLVRILAGVERADAGTISLFGAPHERGAEQGCAFIHQDLALFPAMSVAANIALAGGFERRLGLIDDTATRRRVGELLERLGIRIDPSILVGELPLADQTAVAIARALSGGVRLIVLDEPTAYLEARQVRSLLELLGRLRDDGVACLLITHRVGDVLTSCDSLTVLRDGRTVASQPVAGLTEGKLVGLISGHAATHRTPRAAPATAKQRRTVLELRNAATPAFGPISLDVGCGEVVGVCGLADAGTFELGRAVFGLAALSSGTMTLDGRPHVPTSPAQAITAGVAYVPAERRAAGLAEELSATENIFMRAETAWYRPVIVGAERRRSTALMERFGVYPPDPDRQVSTFSGGNQQKIVLAKWLRRPVRLLVLNEPTAGVDLAAKADIHDRLREACRAEGFGVLLISSDFTEVSELADRIYVLRRKLLVEETGGVQATPDRLVSLAYGGVDL